MQRISANRHRIAKPLPAKKDSIFEKSSRIAPALTPDLKFVADVPQIDQDVDGFISDAAVTSVHDALERFFSERFDPSVVVYWQYIPSLQQLYSRSFSLLVPLSGSLAGCCFSAQSVVRTTSPLSHPSFSSRFDAKIILQDSPVIVFPLNDFRGDICGVVEIVRATGSVDFGDCDDSFIHYFIYKFRVYSRFLVNVLVPEPIVLDFLQLGKLNRTIPLIVDRLAALFGCHVCEIWRLDKSKNVIVRFTEKADHGQTVRTAGIAQAILEACDTLNCADPALHRCYQRSVDSNLSLLGVGVPDPSGRTVYATVLRRHRLFTPDDEAALRRLVPFVAVAVANSCFVTKLDADYQRTRIETDGFDAMLRIADSLSGKLPLDGLIGSIMEKGRLLTHADRCSLFLTRNDRLVTACQTGIEVPIEVDIGRGIVGETVRTAEVQMIRDAYDSPVFDASTDIRTSSILCVPVLNGRGEVLGAAEMINKITDDKEFSDADSSLMKIFSALCGISIDCARLHDKSVKLTDELSCFFDISSALAHGESVHSILSNIVNNARKIIRAGLTG
jgi:GAF domain-containing protein